MPKIKIATFNIKWMSRLFGKKSTKPLTIAKSEPYSRSVAIAYVIKEVDPDILGICESPNSSEHLTNWVDEFLPDSNYGILMADKTFRSPGQQELAFLYNKDKVKMKVAHEKNRKSNPFNAKFEYDTDQDRIKEIYKFYRPALEAKILDLDGKELARVIQAHPKSKCIFNKVDMLNYERVSRRNRLKLYAECALIRQRVDQWLDENYNVIVMGDFNDGPGMDYYEFKYGRSAIEQIMGSIWTPDRILRNAIEKPEWKSYGWSPSSARYKDRYTEDYINVLIDHILVSHRISFLEPGFVWNPFLNKKYIKDKALQGALKHASDHFPVSVQIKIN